MVKILVREHGVYPWQGSLEEDGTIIRGVFYYDGKRYEHGIPEELRHIETEEEFQAKQKKLTGRYALICRGTNRTFFAVDRISIYPLFYGLSEKNDMVISDSFALIEQETGAVCPDTEGMLQFLSTQSTYGNRTLSKKIQTLMAGQYAVLNHETQELSVRDYDTHSHTESYPHDEQWLTQKHEEVLDDVFSRMIQELNGKKVILFLSGGYDSRLVALQLKKHGYSNVICVSFGKHKSRDFNVAKEVAAKLGFEWMSIEADPNAMQHLLDDESKKHWLTQCSNGFRTPYLEAILLRPYFERGILPKDGVIINGNSGDFIEGEQFCPNFTPGGSYHADDIVDAVLARHFTLSGEGLKNHKQHRNTIKTELHLDDHGTYSYFECQELYEQINWRERQSKYVVNSVWECEELHQMEWKLPLWDDALVDYWLNVPIDERAHRKLYYKMVHADALPSANVMTPYLLMMNTIKKWCFPLIRMAYPVKKMLGYLRNDSDYYICDRQTFSKILSYTRGFETNTVTVVCYMVAQHLYSRYFGDVVKFAKEQIKIGKR